ncbi:BTB/POZ domain-containing protein 6-B-like, partial [Paramacrobiotus metropolitanus]|uniref:BTB/POZ domain-containing protein 6-B-like n=1 Tax=Paramacrobiotus metropolitanus TaxID=2943436 RepID=UPI0024459EDE
MSNHAQSVRNPEWRTTLAGVTNQLKHILASGELSDVQFAVGRQYGDVKIFPVHKFMLSLGSDVFHTMFNGGLTENGGSPIDIPEILPSAFAIMLKYLYTGCVEEKLTAEETLQTIYCADKYNLPQLADLSLQRFYTPFNANECVIFLEKFLHSTHELSAGLLEKCLTVADTHGQDFLQCKQFSAIGQDLLVTILKRNTLCAEEHIIYTAVEKWSAEACVRDGVEPSPANRRRVLGPALFLVRFARLTDAQLAKGPVE